MARADAYDLVQTPVDVPPVETRWRRIVTQQPAPGTVEALAELRGHEPRSMSNELPVLWDRAEGFQVSDPWGNTWLDFTSGIFVANTGHAHPRVREAIRAMVDAPLLHSYSFPTAVRERLTAKLVEMAPDHLDTALLLTTGAESTEAAMKFMRLHGRAQRRDKLGIVSLALGFHGKTMGAQTASGRPEAKEWIGVLDPNIHNIPVPYAPTCPHGHAADRPCDAGCFARSLAQLEDAGVDLATIAGFISEPYQGWSAALMPVPWVRAMRAWADEHGALLAFDEVQSGIGRTGRFLAHEHFGVRADLVCCAKGISSSLPLSCVLGRRELLDVDDSFTSTHGGNPVCSAAALATLEILQDEGLIERAAATGAALERRLREIAARHPDVVPRVEGAGMVWALHLVDPESGELDATLGDLLIERAMRRGLLLVRTGTGTIKLGPPLIMPEEAALEGADVIEESLAEALAERTALVA
jgi:4-aminobutyrate aminotransferase / (S)-3-amino-2-methylpropionate transaminase / 5-aminovalerate transaminase